MLEENHDLKLYIEILKIVAVFLQEKVVED